ncbi:hypothetical protein FB45DRAFT_153536 [Roridomyces roridus]|uniref:DUF6535 domain-containing protein n=1 Tax=Roridomyces roridus TaxID=1738132 RepID=A0AAD7AXN0_9AGAR|nr:hypothetical protein FB45DRAFT_153536 [Roridomyces roridus]
MSEIEKHNKVVVECWRADMNSILIFAGLFSGSLTTFLVESYQSLIPTSPDPNAELVRQLSQLILSNGGLNYTTPTALALSSDPPFVPPASALICNILWFLSLGFSLSCALSATLVDQWARNYILATESRPSLHKRARISSYLHSGLQRFQMNKVVETIPTLLHISLLLFFAGLVEFLRPINAAISNLMLAVLLLCGGLYFIVTILPIFFTDCPYQTPLSNFWWHIFRGLRLVGRRDYPGLPRRTFTSMAEVREADATEISQDRDERDFEAMRWTMLTLREDSDLDPLLGFIPRVVSGFDYSYKLLLHRLLNHDDPTIGLRYRIPPLLGICAEGRLSPSLAQSRSRTCLHAIWSLTLMTVPLSIPFTYASRKTLPFDETTLRHIRNAKRHIPAVADSADSTAAAVSRSLLDMFADMAVSMQEDLEIFVRSGHCRRSGWMAPQPPSAAKNVQQLFGAVEKLLSDSLHVDATSPIFHMTIDACRKSVDEFLDAVVSSDASTEEGRTLASEALEHIQTFQRLLNDAGLALALEYVACLVRSPALPYEAFKTLRRLFLPINFDLSTARPHIQSQLVAHLDDALEQHPSRGSRLPDSIINIFLQLSSGSIHDPGCAQKARGIIRHYLDILPVPATRDAALKAIVELERVIPGTADAVTANPILGLLSSHMYANTRLERRKTVDLVGDSPVVPFVTPRLDVRP